MGSNDIALQDAGPTSSSSEIDVAAVMARLSGLGQAVRPADYVRVASYIPPHADDVSEFVTPAEPIDAWASQPLPGDICSALRPLLELQTSAARSDPLMQGVYSALATQLGCSRHLIAPDSSSEMLLARNLTRPAYDPAVLYRFLMDQDMRRADELKQADRSLPLPSYDNNKGFHDSDIVSYPSALTAEGWGRGYCRNAEDVMIAASPSRWEGLEETLRTRRQAQCTSVHAAGGLTWMQRGLEECAPYEDTSDYIVYREVLTRAMGAHDAALIRTEAASYAADGGRREVFADCVLHRHEESEAQLAAS